MLGCRRLCLIAAVLLATHLVTVDGYECYCSDGKYWSWRQWRCTTCPAGYECEDCDKDPCNQGKYQDQTGRDSCKTCPSGSFTPRSSTGYNQCTSFATCNPGYYEVHSPTKSSNRVCEPCDPGTYSTTENADDCNNWRTCSIGKYVSGGQTSSSNRECTDCTNGFTVTQNEQECTPWTPCEAGEYVYRQPTRTSDRQCQGCSSSTYLSEDTSNCETYSTCAPGTYISAQGTSTTDRVCTPCNPAQNKFSEVANAQSCATFTTCAAGTYISSAGTASTDRTCATCDANSFSVSANSPACQSMTECEAGEGLVQEGTASSDRVCEQCAPGYFSDGTRPCAAWRTCGAGQFVKQQGTSSTNRVCQACASESFSNTNNAAECTPWQDCLPGSHVTAEGSSQQDRSCAACGADQFSSLSNQPACTAVSVCSVEQYIASEPTSSSDRECKTCDAGTYATTAHGDCEPWTVCASGTFETLEPSAVSDRTCAACAQGTFSSTINAKECTDATDCAPSTFVSAPLTLSSNRGCTPCPDNTFSDNINSAGCDVCSTCAEDDVVLFSCTSTSNTVCADEFKVILRNPYTHELLEQDTYAAQAGLPYTRPLNQTVGEMVLTVTGEERIDTSVLSGEFNVAYTLTWGEAVATRAITVVVVDTMAPTVTLKASITTIHIEAGDPVSQYLDEIHAAVEYTDNYASRDRMALTIASDALTVVDTTVVGARTVTVFVNDTQNNRGWARVPVEVSDTIDPVLTVSDTWTQEAATTFIPPNATAFDSFDGSVGVHVTLPDGFDVMSADGTVFEVVVFAVDRAGNRADNTVSVVIRDTTAPVITLNGPTSLEYGTSFDDDESTAFDALDGAVDVTYSVNSDELRCPTVDIATILTVIYEASDDAGNRKKEDWQVTVVDTWAPVVFAPPDIVLEAGVANGTIDDATVIDLCEVEVVVERDACEGLTPSEVPRYCEVTFVATDSSGNEGRNVTRALVRDTRPPTIELNAPTFVDNGKSQPLSYSLNDFDPTPTSSSRLIPFLQQYQDFPRCKYSSSSYFGSFTPFSHQVRLDTVDPRAPHNSVYEYNVTASDRYGNSRTTSRTITVRDTEAPEITVLGEPQMYMEYGTGSLFVDPGVRAYDTHAGDVTAHVCVSVRIYNTVSLSSDPFNMTARSLKSPQSVSYFGMSTFAPLFTLYEVTYTAYDTAGHSSTAQRLVVLRDSQPPLLNVTAEFSEIVFGTSLPVVDVVAIDTHDRDLSHLVEATVDVTAINTWQAGTVVIDFRVEDISGNPATAQLTLTVDGWSEPPSSSVVRVDLQSTVVDIMSRLSDVWSDIEGVLGDGEVAYPYLLRVTNRNGRTVYVDDLVLLRGEGRTRRASDGATSTDEAYVELAARNASTLAWMSGTELLALLSSRGGQGSVFDVENTVVTDSSGTSASGNGVVVGAAVGATIVVLAVIVVIVAVRRQQKYVSPATEGSSVAPAFTMNPVYGDREPKSHDGGYVDVDLQSRTYLEPRMQTTGSFEATYQGMEDNGEVGDYDNLGADGDMQPTYSYAQETSRLALSSASSAAPTYEVPPGLEIIEQDFGFQQYATPTAGPSSKLLLNPQPMPTLHLYTDAVDDADNDRSYVAPSLPLWLHPDCTRTNATALLEADERDTAFLVRKLSGNSFVLCVKHSGKVLHLLLGSSPDGFTLSKKLLSPKCDTVVDVIELLSSVPVGRLPRLTNPISFGVTC
eukprot:m.325275 g.325275  ORF g.325275 m.325275 type:complete len:1708 (-) comp16014_c0_seq22:364-5487(-)